MSNNNNKNGLVSIVDHKEKVIKSGLTTIELVAIQHCFERQASAQQEMQLAQMQTREIFEQLGITITNEMQVKLVGNDLILV